MVFIARFAIDPIQDSAIQRHPSASQLTGRVAATEDIAITKSASITRRARRPMRILVAAGGRPGRLWAGGGHERA